MNVTASVILIMVSLTFFAGLIAYLGDLLGTYIGKRRLSLFGVRPKQTGRLIGVASGIVIMLTTIGALAFTLRDTTRQFFQVQSLLAQLAQQNAEVESVQRSLNDLQVDLQTRQQELAAVQQEVEVTRLANQELTQVNESLSVLNDDLGLQIVEKQGQVDAQQNQALILQERLDAQAKQLEDTRAFIAALEEGGVTYTTGQEIHSAVIFSNDAVTIQQQLADFIAEATDKAILRGASELTYDVSALFDTLAEDIAFTESSDIVTLFSATDQFRVVQASIESYANEKIIDKGQLLVSQQIHLGSSESPVSTNDVREELARLSNTAKSRLQRLNAVLDLELNNQGITTSDFANQLLDRLKGPVTIGVIASSDIFRAGPAEIELAVIY